MKKIDKLQIIPEKLIKNEELITLRGGYGGACCWCYYNSTGGEYHMLGALNPYECTSLCQYAGYDGGRWDC